MFKQLSALIIIAVAVGLFFVFTQKNIKDIEKNKVEAEHLSTVLQNIRMFKEKADKLIAEYNALPTSDIDRLEKFLPDSVNNVRLILAVQNVADDLGISIKNVTYDASSQKAGGQATTSKDAINRQTKDYGVFDMNFTVTGRYPEFVTFLSQIEKSLRIVDVREVAFSAKDQKAGVVPTSNEIYQFEIDLRTYWLNKIK